MVPCLWSQIANACQHIHDGAESLYHRTPMYLLCKWGSQSVTVTITIYLFWWWRPLLSLSVPNMRTNNIRLWNGCPEQGSIPRILFSLFCLCCLCCLCCLDCLVESTFLNRYLIGRSPLWERQRLKPQLSAFSGCEKVLVTNLEKTVVW